MSSNSDLASIVAAIQLNNYVSLAIVTVVVYDYIITLSEEIHYIWNWKWSWVSTMFILVRYVGLADAVIEGLYGSSFIPGPTLVSVSNAVWTIRNIVINRVEGTVLALANNYAFVVFLAAADMVMILRLYAMYSRSKIVLGLLLVLYVVTIVLYVFPVIFDSIPNNFSVTTVQVLDMSFCNATYNASFKLLKYKLVPRLTLAGLMFALAVARFCMESFQEYKETRRWETNRYINLLFREGVLYFFAHVFNAINFGNNTPGTIVGALVFAVMFVLSPRFVISVRALHAYDLVHVTGGIDGIDTGFGLSIGRASTASSIRFTHSFPAREQVVEMQEMGCDTSKRG